LLVDLYAFYQGTPDPQVVAIRAESAVVMARNGVVWVGTHLRGSGSV